MSTPSCCINAAGRRARCMFKHALIQDAACQSLPRRARQQVHLQAAELM
jgi:predicted ATPase